jgi:hypothetical protein
MAAHTPAVNPDDTVALYRALAAHAGARRPVTVDDPQVACDMLVRDDGTRFVIIVSHAGEQLTVKPALADGDRLVSLAGDDVNEGVTLASSGVAVLKVVSAR